jgi:hypothetical protein
MVTQNDIIKIIKIEKFTNDLVPYSITPFFVLIVINIFLNTNWDFH